MLTKNSNIIHSKKLKNKKKEYFFKDFKLKHVTRGLLFIFANIKIHELQ